MDKVKYYKKNFMKEGLVSLDDKTVLIKKEAIDEALESFIGKPVFITHKDKDKKGEVVDAYYDADKAVYLSGFVSDSPEVEDLLNGKKWAVSCTYTIEDRGNGGKYHNIDYDEEILKLSFTNLSLVEYPRYEEAREVVNGLTEEEAKNGGEGSGIKGHRTPKKYGIKGKIFDGISKKLINIDFKKDNILPKLNKEDLKLLRQKINKNVLYKKSTLERNIERHPN